jgi:hypothetical protein
MTTKDTLSGLSNDELLSEVKRLAASEREATADLIRSLAEVEARRLHLALGCSSMFGYCTQLLHLSEHAAYARIAAARASTRFPIVMDLLIEGAIPLTTVTLLGRHLTADNHAALLESARHKSKADVEMLVATLQPQPDVRSSVRKLPAPNREVAPIPALAMFPRPCDVSSADATAIDAPSSVLQDVARRRQACNTITVFLRRWRADNCRQSRIALPGAQRLRSRTVVRRVICAGDSLHMGLYRSAQREGWANLV